VIQQQLQQRFASHTTTIDAVHSTEVILDKFAQTTYDVVLWDLQTAPTSVHHGRELLEMLTLDSPRTRVIVVANHSTVRYAVDCLKAGAFHHVRTPVDGKELCALIDVAMQKRPPLGENKLLAAQRRLPHHFAHILGRSAPMQTLYKRIQETAATDITVLLTGETGTGKDLVAATIHRLSHRKDGPYLAVNMGAMAPELITSELFGYEKGAFTSAESTKPGQFEQAHGGTIFLDEISTMDAKTQISLLRLLETRTLQRVGGRKSVKVDVRLISATNESLEAAVARGTFRQDLFYRFDVFRIDLPPLRERHGDILLLAQEFVNHFNVKYNKAIEEIPAETVDMLERYPWPGNVRELQNIIQRAVLMAQDHTLTGDLLPDRVRDATGIPAPVALQPIPPGMTLRAVERECIARTLAATGGNKQRTAQTLGISRRALYNKLERYHLR
jgi:DNA-binding NtrC family response regulator